MSFLRGTRCFAVIVGCGYWGGVGFAHLTGAAPSAAGSTGIAVGLLCAIAASATALSRLLDPPKPPALPACRMTPEDWEQLRAMEAELGWELSEPPPGMTTVAGIPAFPPARPVAEVTAVTWHSLSELPEDREAGHFKALERVGLDQCPVPDDCPYCTKRIAGEIAERMMRSFGVPGPQLSGSGFLASGRVSRGNVTAWHYNDGPYPGSEGEGRR
jgi:hypothetical protein